MGFLTAWTSFGMRRFDQGAGLKVRRYERKSTRLKSRRYSCHVSFIFA
jgi:hypothetical protein